jgi:pantothenate kinase
MSTLTSIESLATTIALASSPERRILVGIVGAPGAGKSTIADAAVEYLDLAARMHTPGSWPKAALLPMDGFHLPQARLVELGRRDRMGAPDTFDVPGFVAVLRDLASPTAFGPTGTTVLAPGFDRTVEEAVPDAIRIGPECSVVVVEGNYLLLDTDGWDEVAPHLDVTIFVSLPQGIRHQRLIDRHIRFGKSREDAERWSLGTDEQNAVVIEATAGRADHTITL